MNNKEYVNTNVRITLEQRDFIRQSEYGLSKLLRKTISKIMKEEAHALE